MPGVITLTIKVITLTIKVITPFMPVSYLVTLIFPGSVETRPIITAQWSSIRLIFWLELWVWQRQANHVWFTRALCTLYSPNPNALLYQIVRKWKIQNKYFLYFKYKIHVLYFVTFSGTSILYFLLIHLFEGYFVFCIKIHFDVFLPISACILKFFLQHRSHLLLLLLPACVQLSSVDNKYAGFFANGELNESVFIWLTWTSRSFFKSSSYQAIGNLYYQKSNFAPLPSSDLTVGLSERVRGGGAPGPVCALFGSTHTHTGFKKWTWRSR